jgi:hypothetical protein
MSAIECTICKSNAQEHSSTGVDGAKLDCKRCGAFSISQTASAMWVANKPNLKQIANASGWIREHQTATLNSNDIEFLLSIKTPSVAERANKVLESISKLSIDLSYQFSISSSIELDFWLSTSYSDNFLELDYLFRIYLKNETDYLSFVETMYADGNFVFSDISITPKGYAYLDSLSHGATQSQIGFCAMWFSETILPIWTNAISPAIKDAGYDPKRIDGHQHNNRIDDEIIAMLRRSKFVVADFTGQRGGVYFEAGFALGLGLQVIWTCKKSDLGNVHFDNRQYNFVLWEEDKLSEFKVALQNRIEATIGHGNFQ